MIQVDTSVIAVTQRFWCNRTNPHSSVGSTNFGRQQRVTAAQKTSVVLLWQPLELPPDDVSDDQIVPITHATSRESVLDYDSLV